MAGGAVSGNVETGLDTKGVAVMRNEMKTEGDIVGRKYAY